MAGFQSRRTFLLSAGGTALARAWAPQRRNVLFIAADDLNNDFSTYGYSLVRSPNLDRIARSGVRFDRANCQFPLCSPSRTSLMTGLAPDTTGVYDLQKHFRETLPDVVTLGQLFRNNGYFSGRVGKIYHYGNPGQIGTDGLDDAPTWNQRVNPIGVDKKQEEPLLTNYTPDRGLGSAVAFYASPAGEEQHTDGIVAAESIRLMEENRNRPFFVGAGFYKPHVPWIAPAKYFDQVPLSSVKLIPFEEWELKIAPHWAYWTQPPNFGMTERQRLEAMRAYFATILFLDAQVGKLLDAVDKLGLRDSTTIVFWSDHGYQLGEHAQWFKQNVFEPSARAPLLIAGAGVRSRGRSCARPVELLDIYPTLADLCALQGTPANLHGASLGPLLDDPRRAWDRPAVTQVRRGNAKQWVFGYSLRTERHRYTMWDDGREGEELYDYARDAREMRNLAQQGSASRLKQQLRQRLDTILAARGKK